MLQIETKLYYMYNYKYTERRKKRKKKNNCIFHYCSSCLNFVEHRKKNQRDCRHRRRRVNIYAKEKTEETL